MDGVNWFKNAIIYHIFIDRFAGCTSDKWNEPVFLGGTIKGITKHLPYLDRLGVNTIWLSPFYKTSAYHGYHITDFFKVDPRFGNVNDLKILVKKVHQRDMRIIADFVPNHCSSQHPYFKEARENKNSPYCRWFYFTHWPDDYVCFLSIKELPKLNLDYEPARDHIVQAAQYWLRKGFDGFRLDHVIGPKHSFWNFFRDALKKEFPNVVLIGEAWMQGIKFRELETVNVRGKVWKWVLGGSSDSLLKEYMGELDGVLDFRFQ
jgi:glycosidase